MKPSACGPVSFIDSMVNFLFFFSLSIEQCPRARELSRRLSVLDADTPVGSPPTCRWLYISNIAATCRLNCNMFLSRRFSSSSSGVVVGARIKSCRKAVGKGSRCSRPAALHPSRLWQDLFVCTPVGEMTKCRIP